MEEVRISEENLQSLELFEPLLGKDKNSMINEALSFYFEEQAKRIEEENNSQTNLSFDEFWDDVDI